ncbi:hypothetical protein VCX68_20750 [Aeromonas caviae]|uniref:hypothetical protein n=1 Tax=Aeromonas caviae TaxID=648 RepID=UPI002B24494D|nr:hypothetical protein [Aeromonas caviae]MEA9428863.1 hypothetical protein [Aeromonas caviae]
MLCREHVAFIALCGDTSPHFTTLAAFVSSLSEEVASLFAQVLFLCDQQGLIGRQLFAIDGVKLPSNASKAKSGMRLSNRTDGESAKMSTSKGVIQCYCGVAVVDAAHQIIIDAQAHDTGSEQELQLGVVTATR